MRILVLSGLPCEIATSRVVLNGLSAGYRSNGRSATAVGIHFREAHRSPYERWAGRHRPGRIFCLGARAAAAGPYYADIQSRISALVERFDFVHYNHFETGFNPILAGLQLACRRTGIPFGVTLRAFGNPDADAAPGSFQAQSRGLFEGFLLESSWTSVPAASSASIVEKCMPALAGRLHVVPNGFDPDERAEALAAAPRGAPPRPFVLCIAGLWRYKGIDILLRSWKEVCRRGARENLAICGQGGEKRRLRELAARLKISDRVDFQGELPRAALWPRIQGSLFTVLPSRREVFPHAIVEAMSCGKAVVATRIGGPQEILEHGITGLLVPPENPAALARALVRLLENPELRRDLGRRARQASAHYRWPSIARRYLDLTFGKLFQGCDSPWGQVSR